MTNERLKALKAALADAETHYYSWLGLLVQLRDSYKQEYNEAEASYLEHEIAAYKRDMTALLEAARAM